MLNKMMKALDKKRIDYKSSVGTSTIVAKMIHPTIEYEVEYLIQLRNEEYILVAWCNDYHLDTIARKTPQAIISNMERIMKNLPRTLDAIREAENDMYIDWCLETFPPQA